MNSNKISNIRIVEDVKSFTIAGLSKKINFNSLTEIPSQWEEFLLMKDEIKNRTGKASYGLCFNLSNQNEFEYLCGVEVTDTVGLDPKFHSMRLNEHNYAVFSHEGHVSAISETSDYIWKNWFPGSDYEYDASADFFFERYGVRFDPLSGVGDIEVWVPIVKK